MDYGVLAFIHLLFDRLDNKTNKAIENRMYDEETLRKLYVEMLERKVNRRKGLIIAIRVVLLAVLFIMGLQIYHTVKIGGRIEGFILFIFCFLLLLMVLILVFVRFSFIKLKESQWNRAIEKGYPELVYELSL